MPRSALLLVCDEEWRTGSLAHVRPLRGLGRLPALRGRRPDLDGDDGVVVRRKAAGTILVTAKGRAAHSGSAPERGRNALLALATAAQAVAGCHDPPGPHRLTAVPTVLRSGDAFNVVPGRASCSATAAPTSSRDRGRARGDPRRRARRDAQAELIRRWPGMHSKEAVAPGAGGRREALGRPVRGRVARRRERCEPLRRRHPGYDRWPRPARRQGPQPGRVRLRDVAGPARRGGARRRVPRSSAASAAGRAQGAFPPPPPPSRLLFLGQAVSPPGDVWSACVACAVPQQTALERATTASCWRRARPRSPRSSRRGRVGDRLPRRALRYDRPSGSAPTARSRPGCSPATRCLVDRRAGRDRRPRERVFNPAIPGSCPPSPAQSARSRPTAARPERGRRPHRRPGAGDRAGGGRRPGLGARLRLRDLRLRTALPCGITMPAHVPVASRSSAADPPEIWNDLPRVAAVDDGRLATSATCSSRRTTRSARW